MRSAGSAPRQEERQGAKPKQSSEGIRVIFEPYHHTQRSCFHTPKSYTQIHVVMFFVLRTF